MLAEVGVCLAVFGGNKEVGRAGSVRKAAFCSAAHLDDYEPPQNGRKGSGNGSSDEEESRLVFWDQQEGEEDRNLGIIFSKLEN